MVRIGCVWYTDLIILANGATVRANFPNTSHLTFLIPAFVHHEMKPIRKAVFPVNGMGTRFLPATKAMPKEMLPVVDMPLIQYAVNEAAAAGITEMIFVTGRSKRALEDHFDSHPELERELEEKGKTELLKLTRDIVPPPALISILSTFANLRHLDSATPSCALAPS